MSKLAGMIKANEQKAKDKISERNSEVANKDLNSVNENAERKNLKSEQKLSPELNIRSIKEGDLSSDSRVIAGETVSIKSKYILIGREVSRESNTTLYYYIQECDENGKVNSGSKIYRVAKEVTYYLIGKLLILNCTAQLYKSDVLIRSKQISGEEKINLVHSFNTVYNSQGEDTDLTRIIKNSQEKVDKLNKVEDAKPPVVEEKDKYKLCGVYVAYNSYNDYIDNPNNKSSYRTVGYVLSIVSEDTEKKNYVHMSNSAFKSIINNEPNRISGIAVTQSEEGKTKIAYTEKIKVVPVLYKDSIMKNLGTDTGLNEEAIKGEIKISGRTYVKILISYAKELRKKRLEEANAVVTNDNDIANETVEKNIEPDKYSNDVKDKHRQQYRELGSKSETKETASIKKMKSLRKNKEKSLSELDGIESFVN